MTVLRTATIDDVPALSALMASAFDPLYGEGWTGSQLLATMALPGTRADVALADAAIAGFTLTRSVVDEVELLLVAVDPQCRMRGIGAKLLEQAIAVNRACNASRMHLEVRDGNTAAIRLYSKFNFVVVGRRKGYYLGSGLDRFDAISMSLGL